MKELALKLKSNKSFSDVAAALEKNAAENQFRVLAVHDVQATLADKGFKRGPLKIIEICNAGFAHDALDKDIMVATFMPCKFTVHTESDKTVVTLARPSMISKMLPEANLEKEAADIENRLVKIMEASV